jgi:hypothetical protein
MEHEHEHLRRSDPYVGAQVSWAHLSISAGGRRPYGLLRLVNGPSLEFYASVWRMRSGQAFVVRRVPLLLSRPFVAIFAHAILPSSTDH